jgi:hypothetical protein
MKSNINIIPFRTWSQIPKSWDTIPCKTVKLVSFKRSCSVCKSTSCGCSSCMGGRYSADSRSGIFVSTQWKYLYFNLKPYNAIRMGTDKRSCIMGIKSLNYETIHHKNRQRNIPCNSQRGMAGTGQSA